MKPLILILTSLFLATSCQVHKQSQAKPTADVNHLTQAEARQAIITTLKSRKKQLLAQGQVAWSDKTITQGDAQMRFSYESFGTIPEGGHSLYISMHGGGSMTASVNDQQWENQKHLYQPTEGIYLAPRAPGNTWDLWHIAVIDTLMDQLIQACEVNLNINPNKVYIMGYSAGGDGCYQLAPRLADHWAAAAMMAGHPGDALASNLRNVPFTLWVGANDSAYNRNKLVPIWDKTLDQLQAADPEGYIHDAHVVADKGHWMDRKDRAAIPWLAQFTRNPYPHRIVWTQDNSLRTTRYWIQLPTDELTQGGETIVSYKGQTITIEKCFTSKITFWLSDAMLDLDKPVKIIYQGKSLFDALIPRTQQAIEQRIDQYYDTAESYSAKCTINLKKG